MERANKCRLKRGKQLSPSNFLTGHFKETIQERARRDAGFRAAFLQEFVEALLSGEVETGKTVLRNHINATVT